MNGRTTSRVLVGLILAVGAIVLAVIAYNAGYSEGVAAAAGGAARTLPFPFYGPVGFHYGFGILGLLFPILFFVLIFLLVRAAFWAGGPRRYGPWDYAGRQAGPGSDLEAWHRRVHEDEAPGTGPSGPSAGGSEAR